MKLTFHSITFKTLFLFFMSSAFFIALIAYGAHSSFSQFFENIELLTQDYSQTLHKNYTSKFYNWFIFSIVIFSFTTLLLGFFLYKSLSQIKVLAQALENFDPNKPQKLSFNSTKRDEIGVISTAANRLVDRLINYIDNIEQLNDEISHKEAHFKDAQRIARVGSWEYNVANSTLVLSNEIYRIIAVKLSTNITWDDFLGYISHKDYARVFKTLNDAIEKGSTFDLEYQLTLNDGRSIYVKTKGKVRKKLDGQVKLTAVTLDMTKEIQNKNTIEKLAYYDTLTGLANRALLKDRMHKSIQKAKRDKTKLAVMFLDLDHFKLINDTLGHGVGDELLQYVGSLLKSTLRASDTLARIGGDEFVILFPSINSSTDVEVIAQKILKSLQIKHTINTHELFVTSSLGISIYPEDGQTSDELIRNADTAMYEAKNKGRNSFEFYEVSMGNYVDKQMHLEQDLIYAVKNIEEIEVFYQAKVDATTNKICGAEALTRWRHPQKGLIFPDEFIYIAESTGLMIELGNIIIQKAISQLHIWREAGLTNLQLSINLSARQFQDPNLSNYISGVLKKYDVLPSQIEFEITETISMSNTTNTLRILQELKAIGVSIAIDDFGTGHSSLSYLKKFPIDTLKVDKSFVMDIVTDEEDRVIVQTIISMAHSLGFKTVAEGVETLEVVNLLKIMDCDQLQGYYYSKPIEKDAFASFFKEYNPNT